MLRDVRYLQCPLFTGFTVLHLQSWISYIPIPNLGVSSNLPSSKLIPIDVWISILVFVPLIQLLLLDWLVHIVNPLSLLHSNFIVTFLFCCSLYFAFYYSISSFSVLSFFLLIILISYGRLIFYCISFKTWILVRPYFHNLMMATVDSRNVVFE